MAEVSMEFLARQIERLINDVGTLRDDVAVQTAMAMRHESSIQAVLAELRTIHTRDSRIDQRLRRLEDLQQP
jgi:hypothetical protein